MSSRIRCPACGTEQEAPEGDRPAACEICGASLGGEGTIADDPIELVDPADAESAAAERESRKLRTFQELLATPPGGAKEEIAALVANQKRADLVLSLVPLWGPWRLWQSDTHGSSEKIVWTTASIVVTLLLLLALAAIIPGAAERTTAAHGRIRTDLDAIAGMVDQYAADNGAYPDDAVWARTAERGDPRFLDPWNRSYWYRLQPDQYELGTYGKDGAPGGIGEDADVSREVPRRDLSKERTS